MNRFTDKSRKTDFFIGAGVLVATLVILIAGIVFTIRKEERRRQEIFMAAATAETTAAPVEPTYPPPEENPYGPEDFQYDGRYLTSLAGDSVVGIDVSEFQGEIDWQQVRDSGVEFVMIRAGFRGYGNGSMHEDEMARTYYAGAKEAGLKVGAYFFSQATNEYDARQEAVMAMEITEDWELDLPIMFDW